MSACGAAGGGAVTITADYEARRLQHRPSSVEQLAEAARRMTAEGHGVDTIARAMNLSVEFVRARLLTQSEAA